MIEAPGPVQPQHRLGRLDRRVVEQALVDVPDLEDRQGSEADLLGLQPSDAKRSATDLAKRSRLVTVKLSPSRT